MQLRLTVIPVDGSSPRPVDVRATPGRPARELLEALDLAGRRVQVDGAPLSPDAEVGAPPLLDGAQLVVGGTTRAARAATTSAPLVLAVVAGPDSGRELRLSPGRHQVGRSPGCDLTIADPGVSRRHAEVVVDRDGVLVRDVETTNRSQVDGHALPAEGQLLTVGAQWQVGSSTLALRPVRRPVRRASATGEGTLAVNPRPLLTPPTTAPTLDFPEKPDAPRRRRIPWVVLVAPMPVAGLLALFFGPRMLLFALLSPLLMLGSVLGDRTSSRRDHIEEMETWRARTRDATDRLHAALALERRERLESAPDLATIHAAARGEDSCLWERRPAGPGFLEARLGLGDLPARLSVRDGTRTEPLHPELRQVPVVLGLTEHRVLALVGPSERREALVRAVLGQLLTLHSPQELQVAVITGRSWPAPFAPLPHLRATPALPSSSRAVCPDDAGVVLEALARAAAERVEAAGPGGLRTSDPTAGPWQLLVVDDPRALREDARLGELLRAPQEARTAVLLLAEDAGELPHETQAIVAVDADGQARLTGPDVPTLTSFTVDAAHPGWAERVAAGLHPLRDATPAPGRADLPDRCRLLDVLDLDPDDPAAVSARWPSPGVRRPVSLAVPVGRGAAGITMLDLTAEGPHALLAGTTGSGKSELLQTWVASLALHLSPEEVSFVLVDYKGGAAFAACADLPHTVGVLTDLDPHHAERALTSLDAELTRRERLLAAVGAPDIDAYTGADPLPRLLLVIDEFRMLAESQPDVLTRLIKIAAVGRSLGVHLVLATQRPAGIVSADIKANVNLRLSLRVRDRADSDDVLGSPDASSIPEDLPGRLLIGSGSGAPRPVQTARVGGRASSARDEALVVREVGQDWPTPPPVEHDGPTDLERLVTSLQAAARARGDAEPHRPWLPPLPTDLDLPEAPAEPSAEATHSPFALLDVPAEQRRDALAWTSDSGHWAVIGGPRSGRTTALRSVIASTTGAHVGVHVVGDGSAAMHELAGLPHVGSVVDASDRTVLRRLLARCRDEVSARRTLLRQRGVADLDAWPQDDPERPAHLLLAIDGWAHLTTRADLTDLEDLPETIETLLREGSGVGLRLLVTGGRELLTGRIASLLTRRLVLHLADRADLALAGVAKGALPERATPGRGVLLPEGHALQIARPGSLLPMATDLGRVPWAVAPLPEQVSAASLPAARPDALPVGVGGSAGSPLTWEPARDGRRILVVGPPGSGRSTAARHLAASIAATGRPCVVVTGQPGDGVPVDPSTGVRTLSADDDETLLALRREHADLAVVVDDADRLEDGPMSEVLREIVKRVERDRGLVVVTAATTSASAAIRGLLAEVARARAGLLLGPGQRSDGDAFGLRLPALASIPGRGYLVRAGRGEEIQVATPGPAPMTFQGHTDYPSVALAP